MVHDDPVAAPHAVPAFVWLTPGRWESPWGACCGASELQLAANEVDTWACSMPCVCLAHAGPLGGASELPLAGRYMVQWARQTGLKHGPTACPVFVWLTPGRWASQWGSSSSAAPSRALTASSSSNPLSEPRLMCHNVKSCIVIHRGALGHSQANVTTENADLSLSLEDLLWTSTVVYGFSLSDDL
ncbi:hypothetical protein C8R44DRAFT_894726 [Mycena epipterygia]|nr:hypothetical protein C8R44DRAFT_894726 [Mycena epipterygia]